MFAGMLQVSHSAVQTLPSLFLTLGRQIERERGFSEVKDDFKRDDSFVSGDEGSVDENS